MSSDWSPARARLFVLWLVPPGRAGAVLMREHAGAGAAQPPGASNQPSEARAEPCVGSDGTSDLRSGPSGFSSPDRLARLDDRLPGASRPSAWRSSARRSRRPLSVCIRRRGSWLERMRPEERASARKLLAAARRALAAALGVPAYGVCHAADLGPLLDGVQSLRAGAGACSASPRPRAFMSSSLRRAGAGDIHCCRASLTAAAGSRGTPCGRSQPRPRSLRAKSAPRRNSSSGSPAMSRSFRAQMILEKPDGADDFVPVRF